MSLNRRRWSNEILDSLMNFQSKESSELMGSLEENKTSEVFSDSFEEITSTVAMLNLDNTNQKIPVSSVKSSEEVSFSGVTISSSSSGSSKDRASNDDLSLSLIKDCNFSIEESGAAPTMEQVLNTSIIEENNLVETENITLAQSDLFNLNRRMTEITENITLSSDSGTIRFSSCNCSTQSSLETPSVESETNNHLRITLKNLAQSHNCNIHERVVENITLSSGSETIKPSSCNSSKSQNSLESQSIESQNNHCLIRVVEEIAQNNDYKLNERVSENIILSSDNETVELSSCNSSESQNDAQLNFIEKQPNQYSANIVNEDHSDQRFFSSPLEFSKTAEEMISEMNEPDVWEALLALEQALSPVEDHSKSYQKEHQDEAHILRRLSQKFKQTPTRFTEKLVSILEDSVVSLESPTKEMHEHNSSGISLHRMTGEFRKLCKFIEDESMPEWAPSLINMTSCLEKTETPEYEKEKIKSNETPKNMLKHIKDISKQTSQLPQNFATPKNQIRLNTDTPIKQFTPSADKSFEYWEKICNMMCESQSGSKKKARNSLCTRESAEHMNEILTICERQLASLDDSTIEVRTSEPCQKTDSELKLKAIQAPRSKSTSKLFPNINERRNYSPDEKYVYRRIDKKLIFDDDNESPNKSEVKMFKKDIYKDNVELVNEESYVEESFEFLNNRGIRTNVEKSFGDDYELMFPSSRERNEKMSMERLYDDNNPDCSLLIELAKRRQRCLDTAKLMLEIDKEDPITNEGSKCLETLYKLGVQDKTVTEIDEDIKFLHTLNECLEYKKYFGDKSKPLINMFKNYDSPDDLKKKTKSVMRSNKTVSTQPKTSSSTTKSKISTTNKLRLEPKNTLKSLHDRKMAPRTIPKTVPKSTPNKERKISPLSDLRQVKITPRMPSRTLIKENLGVDKKNTQLLNKITPKLTPRVSARNPQSDNKFTQLNKIISKPTLKITPKSDQKKSTPKLSVPKIVSTPENAESPSKVFAEISPVLREKSENSTTPKSSPKMRLFVTPGKSPTTTSLRRKKPPTYFSDTRRPTPQKMTFDSVKSPIGLYIHGTDAELIQTAQTRINDRLLTPVSNELGNSPKLKFKLSSKENKSPNVNENIVLPTVRYQSAQKVRLIDDKSSYSPSSITPNSVTKKLLGPIENTVVIRHEGRVIEYCPKSHAMDSETSIRVQKMAEKASSLRKKFV